MVLPKKITLNLPELFEVQDKLVNASDYDPRVRFVVGALGSKAGKAIDVNEVVPTPNGFKSFLDLQVGDEVFDDLGKSTKVIYVSPIYLNHKCYKVVFRDGTEIIADAEHLWYVHSYQYGKSLQRAKTHEMGPEVVNTEHIKNNISFDGKHFSFYVPVCGQLEFGEKKLLIDPFVFGEWLGDGTGVAGVITTDDQESLDEIERRGYSYHLPKTSIREYRIDGLTKQLKDLGVLGNKHIPDIYLFSSKQQRLDLLAGLLDSDGYVSKRGHCFFYNTNKQIADSVEWLLNSLGEQTKRNTKQGKLYGVNKKLCYIVTFTPKNPLFRLKRKQDRVKIPTIRMQRNYIIAVEEVESIPVRCIKVENPNGLFLVSRKCTITHNTFSLSHRITRELWLSRPGDVFTWAAPIQAQTNIAYHLIKQFLPEDYYKEYKRDGVIVALGANKKTERGMLFFKSALDPGHLRGHANRVFVLDEAAYAVEEAFNSLMTTVTRTRGKGFCISTPRGRGWFYQKFSLGDKSRLQEGQEDLYPEWLSFKCPTWTNPTISAEAIEEMRRATSDMIYQQDICAEFISDREGVFGDFTRCLKGVLEEPQPDHYYVMGLDIAVLHDWTVITIFDRLTNHLVYFERFTKVPWPTFYDRVITAAKKYGNLLCVMDSTGIGDPVITPLQNAGINLFPYKISGSTAKHNLIEKLRIAIEHEKISFPPIPVLMDELVEYEYKLLSNGQFSYSAPSGHFDDTVISIALGNWVLSEEPFVYTFANYRGI